MSKLNKRAAIRVFMANNITTYFSERTLEIEKQKTESIGDLPFVFDYVDEIMAFLECMGIELPEEEPSPSDRKKESR